MVHRPLLAPASRRYCRSLPELVRERRPSVLLHFLYAAAVSHKLLGQPDRSVLCHELLTAVARLEIN